MLRDRILEQMKLSVDRGEMAGCSMELLRGGESLLRLACGCADLEKRTPVTYDSIFRLYSQTKPVTAVAAAMLMERGQLDAGSWVSDFLPGFKNPRVFVSPTETRPAKRNVTVADLFNMTAGLSYPGGMDAEAAYAKLFSDDQEEMKRGGGLTTVELANEIGKLPLAFDPGSAYKYSTCADVLGAVVELVDGRPFGRFLKEELFDPLGMKDTAFYVPTEKQSRLVTCYKRTDGGLRVFDSLHLCVGDYSRPPRFESGGAGLVSTLNDYAKFASMLLGGGSLNGVRYLSPRTVEWLTAPFIPDFMIDTLWDNQRGYSYAKLMRVCVAPGKSVGLARRGEYGWDGWLGTYFANFPEENLTLLFCQNTTDAGTSPLVRKIRNLILSEM